MPVIGTWWTKVRRNSTVLELKLNFNIQRNVIVCSEGLCLKCAFIVNNTISLNWLLEC